MANIRDIAKITGYSVSTISRVINDYPYVDEEKRKKVLTVMKELNYVPNRTARNLSYGRTGNIGVIIPFIQHPYFNQLANGIVKAAFNEGYKVTLLPTGYDQENEKRYLDEFAAKLFDGIIVTSRANPYELFEQYRQYGEIVFCDEVPLEHVGCAFIDREHSIKEALLYLKEQGVQRLGVTLGRSRKISRNSKITIQLCHEVFPDFDEELVFWDCTTSKDAEKAAVYFKEHPVDGILTNGDEIAATLLYELPTPPIVIGRENLLISKILGFSTIDHHLTACGETAFKLCLNRKHEKIKLPYEFILR